VGRRRRRRRICNSFSAQSLALNNPPASRTVDDAGASDVALLLTVKLPQSRLLMVTALAGGSLRASTRTEVGAWLTMRVIVRTDAPRRRTRFSVGRVLVQRRGGRGGDSTSVRAG
jgi:hypothetical protein